MRQVSEIEMVYGIIGDGRVANHFIFYFNSLSIPFKQWSRKTNSSDSSALINYFEDCEVILILISDDAILPFIKNNLKLVENKKVFHFSGSLVLDEIQGVHPLMSFSKKLYDLETYQKIPFVVEKGRYTFSQIFPKLSNPFIEIASEKKIHYHALCSMAGNFSTLLWQKLFTDFENKIGIKKEFSFPYLERIFKNLEIDSDGALTGPLARKDFSVVESHLKILENDEMAPIYREFVRAYFPEFFR